MAIRYGKFEIAQEIKSEQKSPTFARFIAEPFERGFGHTMGNAFRRVMLTSMEAPAFLSVRIEGVLHEYTAIEGIIEDMTHIVLNLKGALLRKLPLSDQPESRSPKIITKTLEVSDADLEKHKGVVKVSLKDILGPCDYEAVNPDLIIFTATKPMTKRIDLRIGIGRGYVSSERHTFEPLRDEIILDSAFSPVRIVNYYIENTRVGQDTDFDRLILDVTTDGRVTPEEALTFASQILIEHVRVFDVLKQVIQFEKSEVETNHDRDELLKKLALKISEIELSVRSTNCLAGASIETIGELVVMPETEMLKFRNFGKKSLTEIKEKLLEMSLSLGMDLSRFDINRENVKEVIKKYLEESSESES